MGYQIGSSPLQARSNMPYGTFFLILAIIFLLLAIVAIIVKIKNDISKSEKHDERLRNRITTSKDISTFSKNYNLSADETKMISLVCKFSQCPNINFQMKNNDDLQAIFRKAYDEIKLKNYGENFISLFFNLLYKLEQAVAQIKSVDGTKRIPAGTTVFYLTHNLEKLPFYVTQNTEDAIYMEIPEFFYKSPDRPKPLEKMRFTFKTNNGLACNFISRVIRYDASRPKQIIMVIAHSDKFSTQVQRKYKRDFCQEKCIFSSVKINDDNNAATENFVISDKTHEGSLMNISAGGCCLNTSLPIVEGQYIALEFPTLNITEKLIGMIIKTRRLSDNTFAVHIQFTRISTSTRNRIFAYVYKYEL